VPLALDANAIKFFVLTSLVLIHGIYIYTSDQDLPGSKYWFTHSEGDIASAPSAALTIKKQKSKKIMEKNYVTPGQDIIL
jgi:hypothetical protein